MSASGDGRLLSLPPPPSGHSVSDQSVFQIQLSRDGSVAAARYDLGLGGGVRSIVVWTGTASLPSLVASQLRGTPGDVDLMNPDVELLSSDGSTIAGGISAGPSWLLRLP